MYCVYCRREIREDDRRFYSRQAGMKGLYHWECFVEACHQANRVGANEIENIVVSDNAFESYPAMSFVGD